MPSADSLRRAADLLAEGVWEAAHTIVQDDPSKLAAWMHGFVHLLEGDVSNARYWYGQARRAFPGEGAAIVTGGYAGIGLETTRVLAAAGADVIVPARDIAKATAALSGLANVTIDELDLGVPRPPAFSRQSARPPAPSPA